MSIEETLRPYILQIENPSRYFPSEYIYGRKTYRTGMTKCAVCFPDLYEIGMSNNSVRIIYNQLNNLENVYCDRVFSVAPDFEELLRKQKINLFTLENNFILKDLDFLGISIGSELAATNILQILDLGGIPLHASDRGDNDPIVIGGGPASTNPLPFSPFFDFFYVGEAEAALNEVVSVISECKTRAEKLERLKQFDFLWYYGKKLATRAVDVSFGTDEEDKHIYQHYAVPSFEVVQDHGTAEIMRGCPNGCRFCHAGQYYKPFRQRKLSKIAETVKQNVEQFGYREITLSSLSSGDYPDLDLLIGNLNSLYGNRKISFSLPSLKVSSFSLDILERISEVRKSGLTFAVETPLLNDQRSLNKEVYVEQLISIIREAKSRGWKLAKFYFMVGLPFVDFETEEKNITDFLLEIRTATKINMNINIGTFIPKAHTPFQRVKQLTLEESQAHLKSIKKNLMTKIPGIKVSYHEPSISFLEGLISRGSVDCAKLIEKVYLMGCRLDAWDEYLDFDKWQQAVSELDYKWKNSFEPDEELPWSSISMNVSQKYLEDEFSKASKRELTSICSTDCNHKCGVCSKKCSVLPAENCKNEENMLPEVPQNGEYRQVIIRYSKSGRAVLNAHMSVMRQFEMAFQRAGIRVGFTEGFNPKPRLEFANPLSMGVYGESELLLCEIPVSQIDGNLVEKLNSVLAEGFTVKDFVKVPSSKSGRKISLASLLVSSDFTVENITDSEIKDYLDELLKLNKKSEICFENEAYKINIQGEKNFFKTVFGDSFNKFYIAQNCKITRNSINLKEIQ